MKKKRCIRTVVALFLVVFGVWLCEVPVDAATKEQKEGFRAELEAMLYSADTTVHNVSQYRMTVSEFEKLYAEMENGDCQLIIASYYSNMYVDYTTSFIWIDTIQIKNVDSDVLPRYERLKVNVENIMSGIEEGMTDLDKIIYLHDEIVDLTTYRKVGYQSYGACGVLGDKTAVCAGYTKAYNLLLGMEGIETYFADGDGINHGWTYVNIDGKWYHADPTWDDTRSAVSGVPSHQFLLRNDAEFAAEGANSHVAWKTYELPTSSTSTRFTDWYVHDITGKMSFEAGYWYYVDTANNDIVCADALGQEFKLVLDGTDLEKLTLVDVEDGMITYKVGGSTVKKSLASIGNDGTTASPEKTEPKVETSDKTSTDTSTVAPGVVPEDAEYDYNDINVWREGRYSSTNGNHIAANGYICTKQLMECEPNKVLQVRMKDARFHAVISEYTEAGEFICATEVVNGDKVTTSSTCASIGVSIYFPGWNAITFSEYNKKFTYGLMTFELIKCETTLEEEEAETVEPEVEMPDETVTVTPVAGELATYGFNNINNWREGRYSATDGSYISAAGYIATKEVIACQGGVNLQVAMKDTRFHAVISEYTEAGAFIRVTEVMNGDAISTSNACAKIGVSIYFPGWSAITFSEYNKKFTYGLMSFELTQCGTATGEKETEIVEPEVGMPNEAVTVTPVAGKLTTYDFNNISNWCGGRYSAADGSYVSSEGYIATKEVIACPGGAVFQVAMKDTRFRTVICEYNAKGNYIESVEVADGDLWTSGAETQYITVSMYFPNWKSITFEEYTTKFTYGLMSLEIKFLQ